jgi:hypothetical protein
MDGIHDLLVIPAGGKLGFAGISHAMPMTTSAGRVAVENVRGTFRSHAERVQRRTLPSICCVPAGTIRQRPPRYTMIVTAGDRPTVGGAECLVTLRAGPQLGRFGLRRRSVAD